MCDRVEKFFFGGVAIFAIVFLGGIIYMSDVNIKNGLKRNKVFVEQFGSAKVVDLYEIVEGYYKAPQQNMHAILENEDGKRVKVLVLDGKLPVRGEYYKIDYSSDQLFLGKRVE